MYLAHDRELDREVALKVLHIPDPSGEAEARLRQEARILARLEHPGIVPIHDVGRLADGRNFYVMKRVGGDRLDAYAHANPALKERLRVFLRIVEALASAHGKGVVHRDLKPENVMVGDFGEVLVLDWGVAKWPGRPGPDREAEATGPGSDSDSDSDVDAEPVHPRATQRGSILGTPGYMAPEQARGRSDRVDRRSDVYALGAMLYFLLTLQHPRGADSMEGLDEGTDQAPAPPPSARDAVPSIPRPLDAIQRMAMAHDPAARYPDCESFAADLMGFLDAESITAFREGPWARTQRLARKYRAVILLVLAYMTMRLLLIVLGG